MCRDSIRTYGGLRNNISRFQQRSIPIKSTASRDAPKLTQEDHMGMCTAMRMEATNMQKISIEQLRLYWLKLRGPRMLCRSLVMFVILPMNIIYEDLADYMIILIYIYNNNIYIYTVLYT
jgi:hypothetical protein